MKLSDKIRIIRKARGLTQEQLGYRLSRVNENGISRQTVSDWENGNFEPKLENIRDLADALNVSFDALLDETIDLENEQILHNVLNKTTDRRINDNQIKSSINYLFAYYYFSKSDIIWIVLAVLFDVTAIFLLIHLFSRAGEKFETYNWFLLFGASITSGLGIVSTIRAPFCVKNIIYGRASTHCGKLTNDCLKIVSTSLATKTTIIPLNKIAKMDIDHKANKRHGTVLIYLKDNENPIVLKEIKMPYRLVEMYNSASNTI